MSDAASTGLIARFARHPNAANLLMALMLLIGVFGLARINTQFFPTVETNRIEIGVEWAGASAEDVASNILDVLEPAVRFLDNVDEARSSARQGKAVLTLEFVDDADMQKALSDVEQAVAGVATLPADADQPQISRAQFYETVAKVAVRGPFSEAALKNFARTVRDALLDAGVDKVVFAGARDTEFVVEVEPGDLRQLELSVAEVAASIGGNSLNQPSGDLGGAVERQVRTLAEAETPASIGRIPVLSLPTGEQVRVRDLAVVREQADSADPRGLSEGRPAIELSVLRAASADTLKMAEALRQGLDAVRAKLPASLEILTYQVDSDRVAERIGLLLKNGATGLILVLAILFLFLNARIALWVAAGVPVALMATLGLMLASGQSINMISLLALIMMLGVIVDDAIVVGEQTATRLAAGDDPETAAIAGARRMVTPVIAAMATSAAAFAPIFLISDTIGQMMSALPMVAIAVLVASLVECFLILPGHLAHALAARRRRRASMVASALLAMAPAGLLSAMAASAQFAEALGLGVAHAPLAAGAAALGPGFAALLGLGVFLVIHAVAMIVVRMRPRQEGGLRGAFDRGFARFRDRVVGPLATMAVRLPYLAVCAALATMILSVGLLHGGRIPFVFFPSPEAENIIASVTFQSGLPEERAVAAIGEIEAALSATEQRLVGDSGETLVQASFTTLGASGHGQSDGAAQISVQLASSEIRTIRTPEIVREWRERMPQLPGVKRVAISERRAGPPGRDLDIRIRGGDVERLKAASLALQRALQEFPGVSGVDDDLPFGKPELALRLTSRGRALGFTVETVGQQIRDAIEGRIARRIPTAEEEIVVRVRQALGGSGGALRRLEMRTPAGAFVPLTEVVTLTDRQGFSVIQRRDGATTVSVTADVDPALITTEKIIAALTGAEGGASALDRIADQHGVQFSFAGRASERAASFTDLRLGALAALGAIYLILAAMFASYLRPLAVMLIIPFGAVGALLGHWAMGTPLTILSFIGLLGLSGILVNDSIILVSRFMERLGAGEAFETAAAGASRDRLRAVLLTSLTTIGGLTPLLFETSLQAQFMMPMVITIVFGLGVSTLFVLFLTPALLAIGRDVQHLVGASSTRLDAT